ncbi:MAG: DUF4132 domain-containing protein [Hyphomicrobiaceae bacterium]
MTELSEIGTAFLAVIQSGSVTHPRFVGRQLDPSGLSPRDIGRLLPAAFQTGSLASASTAARNAAWQIIAQAKLVEPQFSSQDARTLLKHWVPPASDHLTLVPVRHDVTDRILQVISGCSEELPDISALIAPHLPSVNAQIDGAETIRAIGGSRPHGWLLLASMCDTPGAERLADTIRAQCAESSLLRDEVDLMLSLPRRDAINLARIASGWAGPRSDDDLEPRGTFPLGLLPPYLEFARRALEAAIEKAARIHAGHDPYVSDKAFTPTEGQLLGRCVRAAHDQKAPWLNPLLARLWNQVSIAPGIGKSVPSQSVAIALGRVIEDAPSASTISIMREVINNVRHAGVKKKLSKFLHSAERRLAESPDFIMQLPADIKLPKAMVTTARRAIEAFYNSQPVFSLNDWADRFARQKELLQITSSLIWRVEQIGQTSYSAMPIFKRDQVSWRMADGNVYDGESSQSVTLWHPLPADDIERDAWRDHVMAAKIKQPFLQAFRQFYRLDSDALNEVGTTMFANHTVDIKTVMGISKSTGWSLEPDVGFSRRIGAHVFHFDFGRGFYPGCLGAARTGPLLSFKSGGRGKQLKPVALGTIDPVIMPVPLVQAQSWDR